MNDFFDALETEKMLDMKINNILSQGCNPVILYRTVAEKANFIANLLPQMNKFNFKINKEILEVATRKYSFLFFPELTHLSFADYVLEYNSLYSTVFSLLSGHPKKNILDMGCGVCDLAAFLSAKNVFDSYHAVDQNQFVVNVNQFYYNEPGVIHECSDFMNYTIPHPFDYIFFFNVVKHLKKGEVKQLFERLFFSSPNATILIQDVEEIVTALFDEYMNAPYKCYFESNILCISKCQI